MNKKNLFFTIFFVLIFSISVTSYGVPDFVLDKMEFENGSVFVEDAELKVLHKGLTIDCQYQKCEWELDIIDKVPKGVCINTTHLNFLHEGDPMPKYVYGLEETILVDYDCSTYEAVNCVDEECNYNLISNLTCVREESIYNEEYCYNEKGNLNGYFVAPPNTVGKYDVSLIYNNKEYLIDPTFITTNTSFNNGTYNKTMLDIDGFLKLTNNDSEQELALDDSWFDMDRLFAYYKFNENPDDLTGNYDGIVVNGVLNTTGKLNGAYDFPGTNQYVDVSAVNADMRNFEVATFNFWFKIDTTSQVGYFFSQRYNAQSDDIRFSINNGNLVFDFDDGTTQSVLIPWTDTTNWNLATIVHNGTSNNVYINGKFNQSVAGTYNWINTGKFDSYIGARAVATTNFLNGQVDEFSIWNRTWTDDEVTIYYNRTQGEYIDRGNYKSQNFTNITSVTYEGVEDANLNITLNWTPINYYFDMSGNGTNTPVVYNVTVTEPDIGPTYTSIKHFDSVVDNVTFDSSTPITLTQKFFNLTSKANLFTRASFNTIKATLPQSTSLYMIENINGVEIYDTLVRTMTSSSGWGIGTKPTGFKQVNVGENNLTIEVYETGQGSVTIANMEIHIIFNETEAGNDIDIEYFNETFNFTTTTYQPVYILTFNKGVEAGTIFDITHIFSSTGQDETDCYISNTESSAPYGNYLSGSGVTRSSGIAFKSNENQTQTNFTIYCKSLNGETITNTISGTMIADKDLNNNLIQSFSAHNTNFSIGAGTHQILNLTNFEVLGDGDEIETITTIVFGTTTDGQTPQFYIELNGTQSPIYSRTLSGNTDKATGKFYNSFSFQKGDIINGSINAIVETGESVDIVSVSGVLFTAKTIDTTIGNLPPIVFIDIPDNGSNVSGRNQQINFSVTDLNGNLDYCNVTIHNSDGSLNTLIDSDATSPVLINWTDFAIDTNYIIKTSCIDTQSLVGSDNVTVTNRAGSMTSVDIYDYPATTTQNIVFDVTSNYTCNGFNCIDVYRVINNPPSNCVLQGGETNVKLLGDINSSHGYIETISYVCTLIETINLNISVNSSTSVTVSDEVSINIIQASILTADEESCLFNGTYINGTTCAVGEAAEELNMIGLIFGFFVIICFFTFLGTALKGFGVKVCMYGIALINVVTVAFVMYARQTDIDLALFLRTNFYTLLIIGFGIGMTALIMLVISLMNVAKQPKDDAADPKWGV